MSLDETALTDRFLSVFDAASSQVLTLNKPTTAVNKSKPWVRFSVSLGARARQTTGPNPTHLQLGGIYLQVFVPKSLGSGLIGHSQKMTVAARATAEKKTVGQRS